MNTMPHPARLFWWTITLGGIIALILSQRIPFPESKTTSAEIVIFLVLALTVGGKKINLMRTRKDEEVGSLSLGFAIYFACLLRLGGAWGVIIALACCLSTCVLPRKQRFHQIVFNLALSAIDSLLAGVLFNSVNSWSLHYRNGQTFIAIGASASAFFLINTLCVAIIIALNSGSDPRKVWIDNFAWTAPSYLASGLIGTLAMLMSNGSAVAAVVFALVAAYLVNNFYVTFVLRTEEQRHIGELRDRQERLSDLYLATIESLALAIDAKDPFTHEHILRVQQYAIAIAIKMGIEGDELEAVKTGALLHDIGKLGIPEYILMKQGPLTGEEYNRVKLHPEIGAAILQPVEFPWPVLPVVRNHHERWDGSGYPDRLVGETIPLTARILAVADVYDAITSTRSYRRAFSHERAIEEIRQGAGSQFDPEVVEAFCAVVGDVIREMARQGTGPLVFCSPESVSVSRPMPLGSEQIARASIEVKMLYEVAQSVSGSLGVRQTAEVVVQRVQELYAGATCVFYLWIPATSRLVATAASGVSREFFTNSFASEAYSITRRSLDANESYMGAYDPCDLSLGQGTSVEGTLPRTALIVPVEADGRKVGTINLYHSSENGFTENDRQLLELIAEKTSSALYNGVLFDQARCDSIHDPLTGAFNLRFLAEYVEKLIESKAGGSNFSILCLDLDSFKPINDGFGHDKGNLVLQEVSKLFADTIIGQGVLARFGGDEFVIVLETANETEAARVAAKLQTLVDEYDPRLTHPRFGKLNIGVSVGAATYPRDGTDHSSLLSVADKRMYDSKLERRLCALAQGNRSGEEIHSMASENAYRPLDLGSFGQVVDIPDCRCPSPPETVVESVPDAEMAIAA